MNSFDYGWTLVISAQAGATGLISCYKHFIFVIGAVISDQGIHPNWEFRFGRSQSPKRNYLLYYQVHDQILQFCRYTRNKKHIHYPNISGSMKNQYVITASCNYYQVSTIDDGSQVGQEAGIEP